MKAINFWLDKTNISPMSRFQVNPENQYTNKALKNIISEIYGTVKKYVPFEGRKARSLKPKKNIDAIKDIDATIKECLTCSISHDTFTHPVIVADNNTYESAYIAKWLQTEHTSPLTRTDLTDTELIPNTNIQQIVEVIKRKETDTNAQ